MTFICIQHSSVIVLNFSLQERAPHGQEKDLGADVFDCFSLVSRWVWEYDLNDV